MKKMMLILAACLLLAALPLGVLAEESVQSMIEGLPTVEEFQAMDSEAQLEAYNRTQAAYDAYMALTQEERAEISGAEETFEALFGHFNSLVMPVEAAEEESGTSLATNLLSTALAVIPVVLLMKRFEKKKVK